MALNELSRRLADAWFGIATRELVLSGTWGYDDLILVREELANTRDGIPQRVQFVLLERLPFKEEKERLAYAAAWIATQITRSNEYQGGAVREALLESGWNPATAVALRTLIEAVNSRIFTIVADPGPECEHSAIVSLARFVAECSEGGFAVCRHTAQRPTVEPLNDPTEVKNAVAALLELVGGDSYKNLPSRQRWEAFLLHLVREVKVDVQSVELLRSKRFVQPKLSPRDAERTLLLLAVALTDPGTYHFLGSADANESPERFYDFLEKGTWTHESRPLPSRERLNNLGAMLKEELRSSGRWYDEFLSRTAVAEFLNTHFGRKNEPQIQASIDALDRWLRATSTIPDESARDAAETVAWPTLEPLDASGQRLRDDLRELEHLDDTEMRRKLERLQRADLAEQLRRVVDALDVNATQADGFRSRALSALSNDEGSRGLLSYFRTRTPSQEREDAIRFALQPSQNGASPKPRFDGTINSIRAYDRLLRGYAAQNDAAKCYQLARDTIHEQLTSQDTLTNQILASFCAFAWSLQRVLVPSNPTPGPSVDFTTVLRRARRLSVWAELMVSAWERSETVVPRPDSHVLFLSYKRQEQDPAKETFINEVARGIRAANRTAGGTLAIEPYFDTRPAEDPNEEWVDGIFRWIFLAQSQVCFISDAYLASDWCWIELLTGLIRQRLQPRDFRSYIVKIGDPPPSEPSRPLDPAVQQTIARRRAMLELVEGSKQAPRFTSPIDTQAVDAIVSILRRACEARFPKPIDTSTGTPTAVVA